jgi:hypothetical protein
MKNVPYVIMAAGFVVWAVGWKLITAIQGQPGPTSQVFFDTDGDRTTGHGGAEYLARNGDIRLTKCELGDGGWPASVVGRAAFYVDGEWQREADCNVECRVTLFDANGDGVVDLKDFQEFQRLFTGP